MIGKKVLFIIIIFSMLSACVARPVHHAKKGKAKAHTKKVIQLTLANARTNVIVVEPLLVRKQYCRDVNTHNNCHH